MHDVFAPEPLTELGPRLARAVRAFLIALLALGTVAAVATVAAGGVAVGDAVAGWGLLAGFSLAGVRVYRPPGE
jgi:hypothetical protein